MAMLALSGCAYDGTGYATTGYYAYNDPYDYGYYGGYYGPNAFFAVPFHRRYFHHGLYGHYGHFHGFHGGGFHGPSGGFHGGHGRG